MVASWAERMDAMKAVYRAGSWAQYNHSYNRTIQYNHSSGKALADTVYLMQWVYIL